MPYAFAMTERPSSLTPTAHPGAVVPANRPNTASTRSMGTRELAGDAAGCCAPSAAHGVTTKNR